MGTRFSIAGTGTGLGSLFKAAALGSNAYQDAEMKAALSLAQTDQARANTDKIGQEAIGLQLTNDARQEPIDPSLPYDQRMAREAHARAGGKDMENYLKTMEIGKRLGLVDSVIADPSMASPVAKAYAAVGGKPLFKDVASTGRSLDQFTGSQFLADPGLSSIYDEGQMAVARKNDAQAQSARAAAGASNATAALRRAQTGAVGQGGGAAARGGSVGGQGGGKPMPAAALKMRQEAYDAIGTASTMSADLGAIATQIEEGKLDLGPVNNLVSEARNYSGLSSENSRNYQSFRATIEKLRNDSLRLNKGVQTDGDAQRAWNELLTNINDPKVVVQRLREIEAINQRAIELHQFNLNQIEQNYGRPPADTAPLRNQPSAVGGGGAKAKTVVRTGRDASGRKVVQYSDGSVSHAD